MNWNRRSAVYLAMRRFGVGSLPALCALLALGCGSSQRGESGTGTSGSAGSEAGGATSSGGSPARGGGAGAGSSNAGSGGRASSGGVAGSGVAGGSAGASGGGAAAQGGSGGTEVLGCAPWQVLRSTSTLADVSVSDGALNLDRDPGTAPPFFATVHNNAEIAVAQSGLVGDFDVTIAWEDFQPGGSMLVNGPRIGAGLVWQDGTVTTYVAHADVRSGTPSVMVNVPDGSFQNVRLEPTPDPASLVGANGSFRFQRTAGILSAITTVNSQSARAESAEPIDQQPFTLFICIGDPDDTGIGPTSIKITDVTVTGGGGVVKSDDFSCQ